jgi:hypothetical protein
MLERQRRETRIEGTHGGSKMELPGHPYRRDRGGSTRRWKQKCFQGLRHSGGRKGSQFEVLEVLASCYSTSYSRPFHSTRRPRAIARRKM